MTAGTATFTEKTMILPGSTQFIFQPGKCQVIKSEKLISRVEMRRFSLISNQKTVETPSFFLRKINQIFD
ncbi:hypothetical protein B5F87_02615 [Eubacterium sp. An3]|nr:hypothetical protein B5F87_02615 [Eubacterium sp. An3]